MAFFRKSRPFGRERALGHGLGTCHPLVGAVPTRLFLDLSRVLPEKASSTFDWPARSALRNFQTLLKIQPAKRSLLLSRVGPTFSLIPTFCVLLLLCIWFSYFASLIYSVLSFFSIYIFQPSPFSALSISSFFLSFAKRTVCV